MGKTVERVIVPGQPGPSMREVLQTDSREIRDVLMEDYNDYFDGSEEYDTLGVEAYTSPEFYKREVEQVWKRSWQMACREEHVPNVGDYHLYEIADVSLIIVRVAADQIKAYYNACLHRGRTLCDASEGHLARFRCPFHGMMWRLDGQLGHVPAEWDFPHIQADDFRLEEVKVDTWGGFIFVNMDDDAISLRDFLGDFTEQADAWGLEDRYIAAHVGMIIPANWKVAQEAFVEDYHSMATHPQMMPYVTWGAAQYSVRKSRPHYSRLLFATAMASPSVAANTTEEETFERFKAYMARPGEEDWWRYQDGRTARSLVAEIYRKRMTLQTNGRDYSHISDSEMVDAWVYPVFPNISVWGGLSGRFYRFRPWENDVETCLMEVMFLQPLPLDGPRPSPAKMTLLQTGQKFSDVDDLGKSSIVLDQDLSNIAFVQRGMHNLKRRRVTLGRYQESQIRHIHRTLGMYMAGQRPKGIEF